MSENSSKVAARNAMAAWTNNQGAHPFGMVNSVHAEDRAGSVLSEASAILSMLSAACNDSQALTGKSETSEFDARNSNILAQALDGIGTLVDLANFLLED